jgi:hypothetical protein
MSVSLIEDVTLSRSIYEEECITFSLLIYNSLT